ncbi:MAG: glycosyltransferase family 39 protein [Candidatus Omnitrophica bacterium]|nr:glycosyltransferase family 39 protein [Candidatus Omnitrophota bacterium]MDD5429441.1 glycosyltransferase family 39 protein [Candidatus Omnitrophota bacterium]
MVYLGALAALSVSTLYGFLILRSLDREKDIFFLESLGISYGIGLGLVSLVMTFMALAGLRYSVFSILTAALFLPLILFFITPRTGIKSPCLPDKFKPLEILFLGFISWEVIYAFFRCLIKPIESYDAVAHWAFKAKAIYLFGGLPLDIFRRPIPADLIFTADYPWLLPFSEAYIYNFLNSFNDFASKIIIPLFFLFCIALFYRLLKRQGLSRLHSLIFTFFLASIPQFNNYATIGYADLVLGFYYSFSFIYLYLWFKNGPRIFLLVSGIFAALAVYTKCEGMPLLLVNFLVFLMFIFFGKSYKKREDVKNFFLYLSIVVALLIPALALKWITSAGLENHTVNALAFSNFQLSNIKRIPMILYSYQKQFFGIKRWNILWIIFFGTALCRFRKLLEGDKKYLTIGISLIFAGYTAVFILSPGPQEDLRTVSRLFLHFLPLIVFFVAEFLIPDRMKTDRKT